MAKGVTHNSKTWDKVNQDLHEKTLYPTLRVKEGRATGSGTIIYCGERTEADEDGEFGYSTYVMTNHHVVSGAIRVEKKFDPQKGKDVTRDYRDLVQIEAFCVSPDTPILLGDLTWRRAGELEVGDRLIGFDEDHAGTDRKFQHATVEATGREHLRSFRVRLSNGDEIVASAGHRWLVANSQQWVWMTTAEIRASLGHHNRTRPLHALQLVSPAQPGNSRDDGLLAGAFDADGHYTTNGLGFTQKFGGFADEIQTALKEREFNFSVYDLHDEVQQTHVLGGLQEEFRFMQQVRPTRLLGKFLNRLSDKALDGAAERVEIVSVEDVGVQEVVTLKVDAGTYIGAGYAMHNSYKNRSTITSRTTADAEIMAYNEKRDIALLRLRTNQKFDYVADILPREKSREIHIYDPLYVVGCGLGQPPFPTSGHLSGKDVQIDYHDYWQTTAPSIYGNSGGAVYFGETLEFMGIPSRISVSGNMFARDAITHIGYFCPPLEVHRFLNEQGFHFLVNDEHNEADDLKALSEKDKDDDDDDD